MYMTEMKQGQTAMIAGFEGLDDEFCRRLYDMGLAIGTEATLLAKPSFGRLFYVSADGVELCLRRREAGKIKVE